MTKKLNSLTAAFSGSIVNTNMSNSFTPLISSSNDSSITEKNAIASLSFLRIFLSVFPKVIDLRDFIYYFSLIAVFIYINIELVNLKKGE